VTKHCPSCGSAVDDGVEFCPVCGETLSDTPETRVEPTESEPAPAAVPLAAAGEPATPTTAHRRAVCPECGSPNDLDATECANCGASLVGATAAAPVHPAAAGAVPGSSKSAIQTYIIAGLAMVVAALVIYIVSTPEEKTGPPQTAGSAAAPGADPHAGADLPQGHPPVDQGAQMEALKKHVAELEAKVEAEPGNDSLKLELANALIDAGRAPEAKTIYADYIRKNPDSLGAFTDYATSVAAAGNVDSAVTILRSVITKAPNDQRAAFNLAYMFGAMGQNEPSQEKQHAYRDSVVVWLRRVVAIDSTSKAGQSAKEILVGYEHQH
jgi:hypothetical protein